MIIKIITRSYKDGFLNFEIINKNVKNILKNLIKKKFFLDWAEIFYWNNFVIFNKNLPK